MVQYGHIFRAGENNWDCRVEGVRSGGRPQKT